MHRSRLAAISIDIPGAEALEGARFWSQALRSDAPTPTLPPEDPYAEVGRIAGREVFVQQIGDGGPRIHLDIETDDIEAEVQRLEALGATRVEQNGWWVMRDPAGMLFCVVGPQNADFPGDAATWP